MKKIKKQSDFKHADDIASFMQWVLQLEKLNNRKYESIEVNTYLGKTHVWGINTHNDFTDTLIIFPGARTTSLIWDLDRGLDNINTDIRIFLIETNGLPNLSDGATPEIKSLDYGFWANEVLNALGVERAYIAGSSFGGLIAMKLALTNPEKIDVAFLLNPGCLQTFSMSVKNLYYNFLPIISPSVKNVVKFLDEAIFYKDHHKLSSGAKSLLVNYELLALNRYIDRTQKPYYMSSELEQVNVETHLLVGSKDLLFPFQKSIDNAMRYIKPLKSVKIFENVGHGIETYSPAIRYINSTILLRR